MHDKIDFYEVKLKSHNFDRVGDLVHLLGHGCWSVHCKSRNVGKAGKLLDSADSESVHFLRYVDKLYFTS